MKRLHLLVAASTMSVLLTGVLVACSDDDTIVTNDAGPDANTSDSGTPDGATDSGGDGAEADAGFTVETYADKIADTLCNALTRCCFDDPSVDHDAGVDGGDAGAGAFDRNRCLSIYETLGFENSNSGLNVTRQNIKVNQAKAAECVAKVDALACNLDGPTLKTIRAACFEAFEGQVQAGGACKTSLECATGHFCNPANPDGGAGDGGVFGTCTELSDIGESCGMFNTGDGDQEQASDSYAAEVACSWRGGGNTGRSCASYTAIGYKPRSEWVCQAGVGNGEICNTTVSCADGVCDPQDFTCVPVLEYFSTNVCKSYIKP